MKSAELESFAAESVQKVCMKVVGPQKKSAKSLQTVCISLKKSLQKVCKKLSRRRLCRLMQTFEKVCMSLPPNVCASNEQKLTILLIKPFL